MKIGAGITAETKRYLIELLQEFKDVFAWTYQDMPGLSTDIVVHRLPIKEEYKLVQQELRWMRPNVMSDNQRAMIVLFHDLIEVYVDDMIAKSQTEKEHAQVLRKLFLRNSMGCVFGQHDESGRKERSIYYFSKKFTEVYVNQKAIKGSAIADFLANRALEDYEPLKFDFLNEDLMYVATTEEDSQKGHPWKLNFDGASNAVGNEIGVVLVSPKRDDYPFTSKLDFDCTNNMAEYKACIMGIRAAIECKIKELEVYGDSALVIYQLKGEWETRDPKLINYRRLVLELIEEFDDITFCYLP
ncbi:RNA-directed DNA polymerase (Reverse transcriptase), Ribonuclease H [Gossypium australe]|uniref:RNA-directed DNA polymerase (Reverse transcriptase), Ribonuclease H n=1 Tax=Gossypium australe TaxID=47621 RepID=A0A5B6WVM7_9ROSI|nr:RNA-directed DNA polymerase (Reverse transcriptase), Ribonuclease H [Gossypium australe]